MIQRGVIIFRILRHNNAPKASSSVFETPAGLNFGHSSLHQNLLPSDTSKLRDNKQASNGVTPKASTRHYLEFQR